MENLAYLHLVLASEQPEGEQQTSEQASVGGNVGASWDAAGWDEIFDSLNQEEEEIEE